MNYHVGVTFPPQSWKRKMTLFVSIVKDGTNRLNRTKEDAAEVRPGQWTEGTEGESKDRACTRPGCSHSSEQKCGLRA